MKHLKTILLCSATALVTALLAAQAQVPGVNSTLQSVFTLVYEASTSKPTYSATYFVNPAATATNVCVLKGSASRTLRLKRVILSGATGTGTTDPVALVRLNTSIGGISGGTAATIPITAYDTNNAAATGVFDIYTANPTATRIAGEIFDVPMFWAALTATTPTTYLEYRLGQLASPVFVRGTADYIAVNLNNLTYSSGGGTNTAYLSCTFEWTEDSDT